MNLCKIGIHAWSKEYQDNGSENRWRICNRCEEESNSEGEMELNDIGVFNTLLVFGIIIGFVLFFALIYFVAVWLTSGVNIW